MPAVTDWHCPVRVIPSEAIVAGRRYLSREEIRKMHFATLTGHTGTINAAWDLLMGIAGWAGVDADHRRDRAEFWQGVRAACPELNHPAACPDCGEAADLIGVLFHLDNSHGVTSRGLERYLRGLGL